MPTVQLPTRSVPALDGVRALAIVAVLAYHLQLIPGGYIGVQIFFVLSGFLIATLLLAETDRTAGVDLRGFYVRRAARLLPAALTVLVVASAVSATLKWEARSETLLAAVCSVLYVSNWLSFGLNRFVGLLNFTWSLSQEEQFYLVAPWLLRRSDPARRARWAVRCAAAALLLAGVRVLLVVLAPHLVASTYHNPVVNTDALLLGVALALAFAADTVPRVLTGAILPAWAGAVGLIAVVVVCATCALDGPGIAIGEPVASWGAAGVLLAVTAAARSPLTRALSWAPFVWVGRRSYSMYLVQVPLIFAWRRLLHLRGTTGAHWSETVAVTASTLLVAALSTRYLEGPARRWARRRFPDRGRAGSGSPSGTT